MKYLTINTVIGELAVIAENDAIVGVVHETNWDQMQVAFADAELVQNDLFLQKAAKEIHAYLAGEISRFTVPMKPMGGSDFQRKVWQEMQKIPYGETISYTDMAKRIGSEKAVRAVGSACGANPIPLMIPCHRVLCSDGSLGGFAWGMDVKHKLLWLEAGETEVMAA